MNGSVRVLPLLVVAGLCLFALKSLGLMLSGGYVISGVAPASAQNPEADAAPDPAKPAEAAPPADTPDDADKAETAAEGKPDTAEGRGTEAVTNDAGAKKTMVDKKVAEPVERTGGEPPAGATKSELAVLEGLANRRKALDKRERQIDLRENLLKAAEKRVEARIGELKAIESRIESKLKKRDDHRKAQYERLVGMYSKMKPKDAARIFDRLELDVLAGLVAQMKPRIMSAILAEMTPGAAQRLTLEIASRGIPAPQKEALLPKIESRPTN